MSCGLRHLSDANSRRWQNPRFTPRFSHPWHAVKFRGLTGTHSMAREDRDSRGGKGKKTDFPTKKIITTPIRLSYPYVFDGRRNDQDVEYWETEALIPPTKEGEALRNQILDGLEDVMTEAFGDEAEWPRGRNDYHPADKMKYVDPDKIPGPGITKDWSTIRARSYQPPGVVDANKDEVLNKREVYGGRWARLSLTLAAYDAGKSKGVTIYLNNLQLLDNAESFGGRPNADSDFDQWDGDEIEPGSRRERDRDDRGRDREDSRSGRDRGRGDGERSRSDDRGRGTDRSRGREDRDEGRSDEHDTRRGRGARGVDERDTRGDNRDDDRRGDNRSSSRDRGSDRDRSDREASRDGGRSRRGDDDRRGDDREDRRSGRGREDDRDRDREDRRPSRDARDDDRGRGRSRSRDEDREDDRDEDRRPSGRGRDQDDDWS